MVATAVTTSIIVVPSIVQLGHIQQPSDTVQVHRLDQVQHLVEGMFNHFALRHVRVF